MTRPHILRLAAVLWAAAAFGGCVTAESRQQQQSQQSGQPGESFRVFCVNRRIEIGSRTLDDMREARGRKVCHHPDDSQPPHTLAEAARRARSAGGVGAPCACP